MRATASRAAARMALALALCGATGPASAGPPASSPQKSEFPALEALEREVGRLVQQARPSVVRVIARSSVETLLDSLGDSIKIETIDSEHRGPIARRVGSGIVIDAEGHIVTLASVVSGASEILILCADGDRLKATVAGLDDYSGLAVLHSNPSPASLKPLAFAEPDSVKVGSLVTTFSSPGGESGEAPVYSMGFVSGLGVSPGPLRRGSYIKLNAPSTPGSGGGAVLDARGHLVGIVFGADAPPRPGRGPIRWEPRAPGGEELEEPQEIEPVVPPEISVHILEALHREGVAGGGVSYAVPVSVVRHVTEEILRKGSVRRGWVGVRIEEGEPGEIRLLSVVPGGPADKAGLQAGDRIVSFSLGPSTEEPLTGPAVLVDRIASSSPGTSMRLSVLRGDRRQGFSLILGEPPPARAPRMTGELAPFAFHARRPILGVEVEQDIDDHTRARLGAPEGRGLLILRVNDASRAAEAGMQEGDLIVEALGLPMRTLLDLRGALQRQGAREMAVRIIRDRREMTLEVPPAVDANPTPVATPAPVAPPQPQPPRRTPRPRP